MYWVLTMIKVLLDALIYPIKILLISMVYIYKICISPMYPNTCRFYPTCSTYMILAIREWGIVKGIWLGVKRIFRCRPKGKCGEDFVPLNVKGELKWVY